MVSFSLRWPFVFIAVILVVAIIFIVGLFFGRRKTKASKPDLWLAGSALIEDLPQFAKQQRRYRFLLLGAGLAFSAMVVSAASLTARTVKHESQNNALNSRDIVLCLDTSGSMLSYDRQVIGVFSQLLENFDGERIALSIFNATSRTVFPLTDDYEMVAELLDEAYTALDPAVMDSSYLLGEDSIDRYLDFTAGTTPDLGAEGGSSLIGDGLVNCTNLFDETQSERSRSIILATDNDLQGKPVFSLREALDVAKSKIIRVIGLYGDSPWVTGQDLDTDFADAVRGIGGLYFYSDDAGAVNQIVRDIQSQEAKELADDQVLVTSDNPSIWLWGLVTSTAVFIFLSRRLNS